MSANPVNAWDMLVQAIAETTFGTTPAPASTAAHAALAIEAINCSLGPAEVGVVRPKQDRNSGRGMQSGWVEGRIEPIPWSLDTSLKSRAAVDTAPHLAALFAACGFTTTTDAGVSVTLASTANPDLSTVGMSLRRYLGSGLACYEAELLRGCVAKTLRFEGGGGEVMVKAAGVGVGKTTTTGTAGVQGRLDSISVADNSTTTLTITADESKRFAPGYYLWESEIILVTACAVGGTSATITRGALSSTAAAHTSQPIVPYRPSPTYTGSPIAEPTSSVTIGGIATRARSWSMDITTGMDLLAPETGSRYSQGAKYGRFDAKVQVQLVLSGAQVSRIGDIQARTNVALVLSQGTGAGSVVTINAPYCEIEPFTVPDTASDVAIIDLSLRLRDDTGNDMLSIVLT